MKPLKQIAVLVLLVFGVGLADATEGQTLGYSATSYQLMEINLETGDFTAIGPIGAFGFGGLTMAANGFLYGVSFFTDDLWRIDPANANSTRIGPIGIDVYVDTGLTFDACGTLWMFTNRRLYEVDPSTGNAALISNLGEEIMALTARGDELLALVTVSADSQLATIDPQTGTVNPFGDPVYFPTFQQGLDFDNQGRLWGIFWNDGPIPFPPWESSIVRYDPLTGQVLSTLEVEPTPQFQPVFEGNLAISPPQGVCRATALEIPTSSSTALLVLALLLGTVGLFLIRPTLKSP